MPDAVVEVLVMLGDGNLSSPLVLTLTPYGADRAMTGPEQSL